MNRLKSGVLAVMFAAFGAQAQTTLYWTNTASGAQAWNAANWTNAAGAGVTPANGGDASYILAFTPGYNLTLTPSNDFSTVPFVLNGITAQGGSLWSVLLKGGGLLLTNNGSLMPVVKQIGTSVSGAKLYLDLPLTLTTNTLFTVSNATLHVRAVIGGAVGLIVSNVQDGVVTLYSNNTFSGGVNLQSGALEINTANALGSGSLTLRTGTTLRNSPGGGGTVTNDIAVAGDATLNNNQSTSEKYTGRLSGAATLSVTNVGLDWGTNALANFNGVLDLNLNNLGYADGTPQASLRLSEAGLYSATNVILQLTRATLTNKVTASINLGALTGTTNGYVNLGANTLTVGYLGQTNTFAGTIREAKLVKVGAGMLVLSGTNTYSNGTIISNGFIAVGGNQALGTSLVTLAGGGLAGASGGGTLSNVINMVSNASFNTASGDLTLVGAITNGGALTKTGGGILTLTGSNTYTGGTAVNNGTLLVNGSIAGAVTVAATGQLGGTGTVYGAVANAGTNLVTVGDAGAYVKVSGALNISGATLTVANPGTLASVAGPFTLLTFTANQLTGTYAANNLPVGWMIKYNNALGTITLVKGYPGTLIKLQ